MLQVLGMAFARDFPRACEGLSDQMNNVDVNNVDTRQVDRDSLFLLAQLRLAGGQDRYRVKVRNLSAGGMMAEGVLNVSRGQLVEIELRNIGWVEGSVAWKQDNRFGIAFVEEIDPKRARAPIGQLPAGSDVKRPFPTGNGPIDQEKLRKL